MAQPFKSTAFPEDLNRSPTPTHHLIISHNSSSRNPRPSSGLLRPQACTCTNVLTGKTHIYIQEKQIKLQEKKHPIIGLFPGN